MVVHTRVYINKKNFRALPVHPDPEIRISGFRDQEPPGDTWRHPIPLNFFYLYKTWYGQQLLLVKKFCATHPTRGAPDLILYHIQIWKFGFPDPDESGGL